ncbi:MAG: glutathione peroxidase [Candidatus Cloacimonadota bacterium]|nr:MAG: glutathione peroxidase [Candidatus Cloacimonadota bacterium]PIE79275.1 MAG: glutathione peroxidase [Candidatus Delongbacteria bacterium]
MKRLKIAVMASLLGLFGCKSKSDNINKPKTPIYDIAVKNIDGKELNLKQFKGKKILFVNVASKCGFTKQYEGLEKLYKKYKDKLVIIGFPCNQFGGQEPGNAEEIKSFCSINYGVSFPIAEKIDVKGEKQHPVYQWLTQKEKNGVENSSVKWNFQKYLVDENGNYIDFWYSLTKPMSKKITTHLK